MFSFVYMLHYRPLHIYVFPGGGKQFWKKWYKYAISVHINLINIYLCLQSNFGDTWCLFIGDIFQNVLYYVYFSISIRD